MKRCQTTEHQCRALVVSFVPSFEFVGRMSEISGSDKISSLKMIVERLEKHLNAVIGGLWNIVRLLVFLRQPLWELPWVVKLFGLNW